MTDDDSTRADDLRASNGERVRRRRVLGGVAAAVGTTLGFSGVAAAREASQPGAAGADPADAPTCGSGCTAELYCCDFGGIGCAQYCWYCNCE